MQNPTKAFSGAVHPTGTPDRVTRLREDWRVARTAHRELLHSGMPRMNMLIIGSDGVLRNLLDMMLVDLEMPIHSWSPGEPLLLQPVAQVKTLILSGAHALGYEHQLRLLDWMDGAAGRTQIVTTTTKSLLPAVQAGGFIEALYYRLNTVCLDLG